MINKNIKKIDIIKNLSNKIGFTENLSKKIINDLIKILLLNIKENNLNLKNLGSFKIIYKKKEKAEIQKHRKNLLYLQEK